MKKTFFSIIILLFTLFLFNVTAANDSDINVSIMGKKVDFKDASPFIDNNGRILVPVRFVSETLSAAVTWDEKQKIVNINKNNINIEVDIGSKNLYVNEYTLGMDTKAEIINNRCFLPLRYIANCLGYNVNWNSSSKTAILEATGRTQQTASQFLPFIFTGHPRLFINNSIIGDLREKRSEMEQVWDKIKSDRNIDDSDDMEDVRKAFESNALLFILDGNKDAGYKAVSLAKEAVIKADSKKSYKNYTNSQTCGRFILGVSMVYDWCYSLLSIDDKSFFISHIESLASKMELGYPPEVLGSVNGHYVGSPFMVDLLAASVAMYDEKTEMYDFISKWTFKEVVPARNFYFQSSMDNQGESYGTANLENSMYTSWIFERIGWKNIFNKNQSEIPLQWIYGRRPDGQLLRDGDSFLSDQNKYGSYWKFPTPLVLSSSYYNNPFVVDELKRQYYPDVTEEPIMELLFYNPKLPSKSETTLPLSRYFGYPMGTMIARTGWDTGVNFNSSTALAEMKINSFQFNGHQHLDSGSFQIYYKGALAIDSGVYNGTQGEYGSTHDSNYNKRTIAHNSILVYDPNEKTELFGERVGNDGGQHWPNDGDLPKSLNDLLEKDYKVGDILEHQIGPDTSKPDFTYLKGDLSKAYTDKVKEFKRSFVFLNLKDDSVHPAALVVYDKVTSSDKNFKKYWLLHSIEEPDIKNNITTIVRSAEINYSDNNGNALTGKYNGKLVNTTLLPTGDNLSISKIGGSGNEFSVFGKNYPNSPAYANKSNEPGSWRIEVSPKNSSETDRFLNVLQVMDNKDPGGSTTVPLDVKKIESDLMVGTKISNKVVLFSKSSSLLYSDIEFEVDSSETSLSYIITDLEKGSWTILKPGGESTKYNITDDNCVLNFTGKPGKYVLRPSGS